MFSVDSSKSEVGTKACAAMKSCYGRAPSRADSPEHGVDFLFFCGQLTQCLENAQLLKRRAKNLFSPILQNRVPRSNAIADPRGRLQGSDTRLQLSERSGKSGEVSVRTLPNCRYLHAMPCVTGGITWVPLPGIRVAVADPLVHQSMGYRCFFWRYLNMA